MKKRLQAGIHDFKKMIAENFYYVDKTKFIEEVFENGREVKLFTRPRRFGKTLNMSMLNYFFDIENAKENRELFKGLYIENSPVFEEQGQYPVIFISMKDVDGETFEITMERLRKNLHFLYQKFYFIRETLNEVQKKLFDIAYDPESKKDVGDALLNLSVYLEKYYNKKVIVLIDEYDAPLLAAYKNGYYEKAVSFFRTFYSSILKNRYATVEKAVLTGITKVAQTGMFSGLNNIKTYTVLSENFDEYFGFIESEVEDTLNYYEMKDTLEDVKFWYDGYKFGNAEVYNPWSILNYLEDKKLDSYWVKTSEDLKINEYIKEIGLELIKELGQLANGETIEIGITENTMLNSEANDTEGFWQLMLFAGYLTVDEKLDDDEYSLRIPNHEVKKFFKQKFIDMIFGGKTKHKDVNRYLVERNIDLFLGELEVILRRLPSFKDTLKNYEYVYHILFLVFLYMATGDYDVYSNIISGDGCADLILKAKNSKYPSYILEFKRRKDKEDMDKLAQEAVEQIFKNRYSTFLEIADVPESMIVKIGLAFDGKKMTSTYVDGEKNK